jgi:hypothetical protein
VKPRVVVRALALALAVAAALPVSAAEPGVFVAVGYGGRRIMSRDGVTWEGEQRWSDEAKDNDDLLCDIAFGADRFVAVGGGAKIGHILTTRNGRDWQELPRWRGRVSTIAFGNGRFVAAHGAELLSSTDGENFQPGQRLDWKGSVHPRRSACGDTEAGFRFVIIGDFDVWGEQKRVSWRGATGDGARWDHSALDTLTARDIAYGAGHFVVVGPDGLIESSHDGQTWERRATAPGENFSSIVWTGSRFLVGGGKVVWSSPDGLTWTKEAASIPFNLAWAREGALGIGFSWGGGIHISRDLATWKKVEVPPGPSLQAVAFGPIE